MSLSKPLVAILFVFASTCAGAAEFSSLEERMSGDEFNAAGLERLSPDELARLNDWLRANWPVMPAAAEPYPAQADSRGLSQPSASRDAIVSRITGEFSGWDASTTFTLDNGMVWETSGTVSPLNIRPVTNPTVIIEPAFMGTWLLRVEGYNSSVRVKRVR